MQGLIWYLGKKEPEHLDLDSLINKHFKSLMEYHRTHGEHGFLSERTYIEGIQVRAEEMAKREQEEGLCEFELKSVAYRDEEDKKFFKKCIEGMDTFIRYIS